MPVSRLLKSWRDASRELAHRLHLLALAQHLLHRAALRQSFGDALFQRFVGVAQGIFGASLLGDVVAFGEDARNRAVGFDDGLVHEIEEALFEACTRLALKLDRHLPPHEGLAGPVDVVEQFEEALARDLGQRLAERQAGQIPMPDQLQVGLVHEFEHVVRPAQDAHEPGCPLEQVAQPVALGRPEFHLRGEAGVAVRQHVGSLLSQSGSLRQGGRRAGVRPPRRPRWRGPTRSGRR